MAMQMIQPAQVTLRDISSATRENRVASLTNNALLSDYLIVSSGQHAQEDWHTIIERKRRDIANAGHTIWLTNSLATRVEIVQQFCNDHDVRDVLFVAKEQNSNLKGPPTNDPASSIPPIKKRGCRSRGYLLSPAR